LPHIEQAGSLTLTRPPATPKPGRHASQSVRAMAARSLEVPVVAGQRVQGAEPTVSLNQPLRHASARTSPPLLPFFPVYPKSRRHSDDELAPYSPAGAPSTLDVL
jgi:hypothetical protein